MPWRTAPAWPFGPPPVTLTRTSNLSAVPVTVSGCETTPRWVSSGKIIFKRAAVDGDFAAAGREADAGDGGFAPAGAEKFIGFGFSHKSWWLRS